MSGYVVCASCGARIKANRERCLRCGEILQAESVPEPGKVSLWLQSDRGRRLIIGVVGSLALFAIGGVYMDWQSPALDKVARPAPGTTNTGSSNAAATPSSGGAIVRSAGAFTPATALDATRVAGAAFTTGDLDAAKKRYEEALQRKADDPEALNGLGLIAERQGQVEDAIARFTRAAQIEPSKWTYRFNLAHAFGQAQQWDRAIDEYRAASGLFPDDYATQYNLGMALHKKGDDAAAVPEFEKAIQLAPGEGSFHLSLGISLEKLGKIADAQREYQRYLEMEPSAPDADKVKAHLQSLAGGQPSKSSTVS